MQISMLAFINIVYLRELPFYSKVAEYGVGYAIFGLLSYTFIDIIVEAQSLDNLKLLAFLLPFLALVYTMIIKWSYGT